MTQNDPFRTHIDNIGAPYREDQGVTCDGVVADINDINIPIQHEANDVNLVPSEIHFTTDGTPVWIMYHAGSGSHSILNAFILEVRAIGKQTSGPSPTSDAFDVCPDVTLTWQNGAYGVENDLYLGTDLREELPMLEDEFEGGDANWVRSNWTVYDSNVLGDGNSNGNSHSIYHSITPGSGSGTLTTVDIDASDANSMRIELWIKKSAGIEDGDIELYYYNGSTWDNVADLNTVGANDVWLHYTDDVNENEYFVSNFKLELRSNISAGELFIDDVSVTNTWPVDSGWLVYSGENEYTPPAMLELGTTYYWRVDAVNDANVESPWKGRTWNFTTDSGQAYAPSPSDKSFSVNIYPSLSWSASCLANSHDVYFGDDLEDVNNATTSTVGIFKDNLDQLVTSYFVGIPALDNAKQYYWRVDERTDAGIIKGNLWRFFTYGGSLFLYEFDGVADANIHDPCDEERITDSTGNVVFEIRGGGNRFVYGESNPLVNPIGTSATFDDVALYRGERSSPRVRGADITDLITPQYTIEMWIKMADFDTMGLFRKWDRSYGLETDDQYLNFWQAGSDPISSDANNPMELDVWYHIAAVFDSDDPCEPQKLYIDGDLVASGGTDSINPDNDDDPATIGCKVIPLRIGFEKTRDQFDGLIDELRVSDLALLPPQFRMRGDPALAWMPRPKNGAQEVEYDVEFKWKPGDWADSHDIYFGTDYDDVNDANTLTALIYKTTKEPNDYTPDQLLDLDTTYYWRIDEVDDSNEYRWKGTTWSFTVANYIIIDDFEDYTKVPDNIWWSWDNPDYNGAWIGLGLDPWQPVNNGVKSMKYGYENGYPSDFGYYYSEAILTLDSPQDWDDAGVKMLTLYFYGQPDNDANSSELMYVGLEDSSNNFAKVSYDGDMNDIKVDDWQEWNIKLSDFTDVSLSGVEKVSIGFGDSGAGSAGGFGTVYFDDVRIYPPKCVPSEGPAYDFSGNCIIDFADVKILGDEWLKTDKLLSVSEPLTGPVGHWEFEGDANDSSVNGNHGAAEGSYSWVTGKIGSSAIEFTGGKVLVPDAPELNPASEVSVTAWINLSDNPDGYSARVIVKGIDANDGESYGLQIDEDDEPSFLIRDSNHGNHGLDSGETLLHDEWTHLAGVYDGTDIKVYVNGALAASDDSAPGMPLLQDTNDLAIGDAVDVDRAFPGRVDDARVYGYGLTDAEVAYIGTEDNSGIVPLISIANISDDEPVGQKAVNFKDFAVLMQDWLYEQLWP